MQSKKIIIGWAKLCIGISALILIISVVIPTVEKSYFFHGITQNSKEKQINSAGLFYTEVDQVNQWQVSMQTDKPSHSNISSTIE